MGIKKEISDVRRHVGGIGRSTRRAWREHALFIAADLLAAEYLNHPENFDQGLMTYKSCKVKTFLHEAVALAVVHILTTDAGRITTPNFYTVSSGAGRPPMPPTKTPKTIEPPKGLKAESVRDLFKDWRPLLDAEFAARVAARKINSKEYGPEADPTVMEAADQIRRMIERG